MSAPDRKRAFQDFMHRLLVGARPSRFRLALILFQARVGEIALGVAFETRRALFRPFVARAVRAGRSGNLLDRLDERAAGDVLDHRDRIAALGAAAVEHALAGVDGEAIDSAAGRTGPDPFDAGLFESHAERLRDD